MMRLGMWFSSQCLARAVYKPLVTLVQRPVFQSFSLLDGLSICEAAFGLLEALQRLQREALKHQMFCVKFRQGPQALFGFEAHCFSSNCLIFLRLSSRSTVLQGSLSGRSARSRLQVSAFTLSLRR